MKYSDFEKTIFPVVLSSMLFASGCIATRDWVNEKIFPVEKRVSETEAGLTKTNSRVSGLEGQMQTMAGQIAAMDSRLNQTNAKADEALQNLQRLKLDRKLVLDMRQGAMFASNSVVLTDQSKKDIDSFLSDLTGDPGGMNGLLFVVAGYTDNTGTAKYNYELGMIRAANAASYLTTDKKIDPGRLVVMSYGENSPVADNKTDVGRAKNRRVEILVYRDLISIAPNGQSAAR